MVRQSCTQKTGDSEVKLTLRGQAREKLVSKTSQFNKVQPVLSQICDYRPLIVKEKCQNLARILIQNLIINLKLSLATIFLA